MGTMLMDSAPPATMTFACPAMMRSAARAIACRPEEQKRLMVMAEVSTGRPARSEAIRATFIPCSASGMAQPRITSSISLTSRPLARAMASLIAAAARSSGRVARRVPLGALPTAVRTELTMTASRMVHLPGGCCWLYWMLNDGKKQQRAHWRTIAHESQMGAASRAPRKIFSCPNWTKTKMSGARQIESRGGHRRLGLDYLVLHRALLKLRHRAQSLA